MRLVTAALPFATDERSIGEAVVTEPARNLDLASAALFHRDTPDEPLRRVLSHGWRDAQWPLAGRTAANSERRVVAEAV